MTRILSLLLLSLLLLSLVLSLSVIVTVIVTIIIIIINQQIYRLHKNDVKRSYTRRVLDIEHGSFTPLVFTSTGGMGPECLRFHSRLAERIANKKGEY